MSTPKTLNINRPRTPADHCVKCRQPHQQGQHRVVHNQQVSLFANSAPLFDQVYGTEEIRLNDAWFYFSLHSPTQPILQTLQNGQLPWLCPHCAGYAGLSNLDAAGATILNDNGEQRATGVHNLFAKHRHEQEAQRRQAIA